MLLSIIRDTYVISMFANFYKCKSFKLITQVDRFDIQSLFSPRITRIYTNYFLIVNFVNSCLLVEFVVSLALSFEAVNLS